MYLWTIVGTNSNNLRFEDKPQVKTFENGPLTIKTSLTMEEQEQRGTSNKTENTIYNKHIFGYMKL